jgi:hypothetical protein
MTPEAQRIAIAEACGWKRVDSVRGQLLPMEFRVDSIGDVWTCLETQMPDYLNDLNAMHEARKSLTLEQHRDYHDHLQKFCHYPEFCNAGQHAEAFLKTLGLWQEQPTTEENEPT